MKSAVFMNLCEKISIWIKLHTREPNEGINLKFWARYGVLAVTRFLEYLGYYLIVHPADHNHCCFVFCESKHSGSDIVRLGIVTWVLMPWWSHCQLNNANTLCSWLLQTHWSGFLIMLGLINICIKEKIQSIPILYYFLFGSR